MKLWDWKKGKGWMRNILLPNYQYGSVVRKLVGQQTKGEDLFSTILAVYKLKGINLAHISIKTSLMLPEIPESNQFSRSRGRSDHRLQQPLQKQHYHKPNISN